MMMMMMMMVIMMMMMMTMMMTMMMMMMMITTTTIMIMIIRISISISISIRIRIAFKGAIRDFRQSPHCAANHLLHVRSRVCTCNTSSAYHVQHVAYHLVRKDSSAVKSERVEIAFI